MHSPKFFCLINRRRRKARKLPKVEALSSVAASSAICSSGPMGNENKRQGSTIGLEGIIMKSEIDLEGLPEGCIANILSFTTPVDACRLSLVSNTFCSAAQYDAVWDRFLPSDLESIISQHSSNLIATSPSKKALYLYLSDHAIIIDHGKKSFQLDKRTGKKCYMIAARGLRILGVNDPERWWDWTTLPGSRFEEVVKLAAICWFEFHGKINTLELSPNTQYAAFLVYKMISSRGFHYYPVELSVGIIGGQSHSKQVCLDPTIEERRLHPCFRGLERPNIRSDGWLEIKMGEFFNSGIESEEVEMSVIEIKGGLWKHGFFLQGIELRPHQ